MPGKMLASSCRRRRAMRLSRSSSFTRRARRRSSENMLRRSSPTVRGRLMREPPNTFLDYTRKSGVRLPAIGVWQISDAHCFGATTARSRKPGAEVSADVAVAARLFAGSGGAAKIGDDGFEIADQQG